MNKTYSLKYSTLFIIILCVIYIYIYIYILKVIPYNYIENNGKCCVSSLHLKMYLLIWLCLCPSDSRIEWVWLHWNEYLKAHEEFGMWLEKMHRSLEPLLEMQLGRQEKLWQVDHLRVLHSDIQAQAQFLERLLDEATALFNRTEDPSVDENSLQVLQDAFDHIRDRAQVILEFPFLISDNQTAWLNLCGDSFQNVFEFWR